MRLTDSKTTLVAVLFVMAGMPKADAQPPSVILQIDFENNVQYNQDISDVSKLATDPGVTTAAPSRNFVSNAVIADVVAVNGHPAKGIFFRERRLISLTPTPGPGQAVADVARNFSGFQTAFELLQVDGTPVGSIFLSGFGGGSPPPPGAPLIQNLSNLAIVGGTGAFLGARGQGGEATFVGASGARQASMSEDPANRRNKGGGKQRWVLHLIPLFWPQILVTASGPAVYHADFSPVTMAKPAVSGEVLIVKATGLGPTRPGIDPGQPFPLDVAQEVNSPVDVTVNGQAAAVINRIGWPGLVDTYRIDFRVPDGMAVGTAAIQLTAGWIPGASVNIPTY
jgi:hypothetical protein